MNPKGKALSDYCKSLANITDDLPKAEFKEIQNFEAMDWSILTEFDTVVLNCKTLTDDEILLLKQLKSDKYTLPT